MPAKKRFFVGDFETTVYPGQIRTDVWASASVELFTEDVQIFHSIQEQYNYFKSLKGDIVVYYHNLKFDGTFWLYFLLDVLHLKQATFNINETAISDDILSYNKSMIFRRSGNNRFPPLSQAGKKHGY